MHCPVVASLSFFANASNLGPSIFTLNLTIQGITDHMFAAQGRQKQAERI
jgi:hypothetical protein